MSDTQRLITDQINVCAAVCTANFMRCQADATPDFRAAGIARASSGTNATGLLHASPGEQINETDQLYALLCSLNLPVLHLCSFLRLRYFSKAATSVFGVNATDLGTRSAFLEAIAPSADLASVCRSEQPRERTASGYCGKDWLCHMLPHAKQDGFGRGVIVIMAPVAAAPVVLPSVRVDCLTPRQRQIMALVLAGEPSKNIAIDLGISQRTVENHRAEIMRRMGAKSIPALARIAIGSGRVDDFRWRNEEHKLL